MKSIFTRCSMLGLALLLIVSTNNRSYAVSVGGLVFTSFNSGPGSTVAPDTFSFLMLELLPASSTIYFTDKGYFSSTNTFNNPGSTEGTITWTSGAAIAAGVQITIVPPFNTNPGYAFTGAVGGQTNGTVTKFDGTASSGIGISLSNLGDQLFAFQTATTPTTANLISGIHWNGCIGNNTVNSDNDWDPSGNSFCANNTAGASQRPSTLAAGFGALYFPPILVNNVQTNPVQGVFAGQRGSISNIPAVRSTVYNVSNWLYNTNSTGELATPSAVFATPLPVSWVSFTGISRNGSIVLNWKVGSEMQTGGYEVQRSEDGNEFEAIGTQKALSDGGAYQYVYTDNQLGSAPVFYYRLRSLEYNGELQYSTTIRVTNTVSIENSGIRLLHNPVGSSLDLEIAAAADGVARLVVTDLTGRVALQQEWAVHAGRQTVTCNTTGLQPDQIYLLTSTANGKVLHARIVR